MFGLIAVVNVVKGPYSAFPPYMATKHVIVVVKVMILR